MWLEPTTHSAYGNLLIHPELVDEMISSGVSLSTTDLPSSCCRALRSIFGGNK